MNVWKKLKSSKGASMSMALLVVLAAMILSGLAISASNTNLKNAKNSRNSQQAYLAVSSAADMMRDALENTAYKKETKDSGKWNYKTVKGKKEWSITWSKTGEVISEGFTGDLSDILKLAIIDRIGHGFSYYEENYTVTVSGLPDVNMYLRVEKEEKTIGDETKDFYTISAEFSLKEDLDGSDCIMSFRTSGMVDTSRMENLGTQKKNNPAYINYTTTVSWKDIVIEKGALG